VRKAAASGRPRACRRRGRRSGLLRGRAWRCAMSRPYAPLCDTRVTYVQMLLIGRNSGALLRIAPCAAGAAAEPERPVRAWRAALSAAVALAVPDAAIVAPLPIGAGSPGASAPREKELSSESPEAPAADEPRASVSTIQLPGRCCSCGTRTSAADRRPGARKLGALSPASAETRPCRCPRNQRRRGWDSNPRGSLTRPHDFQSCTLSPSVTSPNGVRG
jgi:hypothetical protein